MIVRISSKMWRIDSEKIKTYTLSTMYGKLNKKRDVSKGP